MELRLQECLWPGEKILWSGRPRPFALLDRVLRRPILLTWGLSAVILLAAAAAARFVLDAARLPLLEVLLLTMVAMLLPAAISLRPVLDKYRLEEQTIYAITDRRVISIVQDEVMYLPLAKGMRVAVDSQADGCGNLRFGDTVGAPAKKDRAYAVVGIHSDAPRGDALGLLFYHVAQPEQLLSYLV